MSIPDDIRERMREAGSGERAQLEGVADRAGGDARRARAGAGRLHHAAVQQGGPGGSGDRGAALDSAFRGDPVTRLVAGGARRPRSRRRPGRGPEAAGLPGRPRPRQRHGHRARRAGRPRVGPRRRRTSCPRGRPPAADRSSSRRPRARRSARSWRSTSACSSTPARACARTSAQPAVGDPLPRRDPARARPAARLLRPRHPASRATAPRTSRGSSGGSSRRRAQGYTALLDAITVYLSRVADTPGRKVLVLFTDGDDTTSQVPPQEVQRLVRSSEVTIYPVAFPGEHRPNSAEALRARSFLHALAEASGGRVFQPTRLAGARRHLPVDPRRARQPVRARLRLGQPEARRQVPQDHRRAEAARAQGPAPARATTRRRTRRRRSRGPRRTSRSGRGGRASAGLSGGCGRAATRPCAPARAAASAAPAASRTPRST